MMVCSAADKERQLRAGVCVRVPVRDLVQRARAALLPSVSAADMAVEGRDEGRDVERDEGRDVERGPTATDEIGDGIGAEIGDANCERRAGSRPTYLLTYLRTDVRTYLLLTCLLAHGTHVPTPPQ